MIFSHGSFGSVSTDTDADDFDWIFFTAFSENNIYINFIENIHEYSKLIKKTLEKLFLLFGNMTDSRFMNGSSIDIVRRYATIIATIALLREALTWNLRTIINTSK